MNVYLYQNNTEKILKNIYIGEYGWKPGANTIAYYPFRNDLKDYSGNGNDFSTYSGTTSFVDGMVQTNGKISRNNLINSIGDNFTILMYIVPNSQSNSENYLYFSNDINYTKFSFGYGFGNFKADWDNGGWYGVYSQYTLDGNPHLVAITRNGNSYTLYVDGEQKNSSTITQSIPSTTYMVLGNVTSNSLIIKFGNLIIENKTRTAQEIANYYNQTKSNYGL